MCLCGLFGVADSLRVQFSKNIKLLETKKMASFFKKFLLRISCGVILLAGMVNQVVLAEEYPTRPIKMIIPFAPGGGNDAVGRIIAKNLSETLGQPVVVDNRAGAGGRLGVESGVKAEPDGYTLTLISNSYAANPSLYKINFDPNSDISPIGLIAKTPLLVAIRENLPVNNVTELIQYAKLNPGKLSYASSGQGGISHLSTELFLKTANIQMVHIPYKGTSPAVIDLVSGTVDVFFSTSGAAIPHMRTKKIRVIAVTTPKRSRAEPSIPTIMESGLPSYGVTVWYGLIGPKNLPQPIMQKIHAALSKALEDSRTLELFRTTGDEPYSSSSDEFKNVIRQEIAQWQKVVIDAKIKANSD
jgi:hypothetical protein